MYRPKTLAIALVGLIFNAGAIMADQQQAARTHSIGKRNRPWNQPKLKKGASAKNTLSQKGLRRRARQARSHNG
jgi:hypothetical protein